MPKIFTPYNIFSALAAFFGYGGWAYYINHKADPSMGLISAITQGISSFSITFITAYAVSGIYCAIQSKLWRILMPAIILVSILIVFLCIVHSVIGTPRILFTIIPSILITFLFCLATAYKLELSEKKELTTDV